MSDFIIGTAGHIDHGKTELIKALTGTDTDRLKEEKERGISIELGFAQFTLPSGRTAGVVDVPGHERFVKNMLAGASGFDMVLLTVAADDGIMPQTREHLAIIDLLGVSRGVVVITKTDLVDPEMVELQREEVEELLKGTSLEGAEIVAASAVSGEGLNEAVEAIERVAEKIKPRTSEGPFRLPIDRVFTLKGIGTVVTGTLWEGSVSAGEEARILPEGRQLRLRSVQVHGREVQKAYSGQRVALNLPGISTGEVSRGDVVVASGYLEPTTSADVRLFLLPQASRPLKNRTRVRFHHGTSEVMCRIYLMDHEDQVLPGESALAQLRLEREAVVKFHDRFIIRSYSPMTTIGGGVILNSHPPRHKRGDPLALAELELRERGEPTDMVRVALEDAAIALSASELFARCEISFSDVEEGIDHLLKSREILSLTMEGKTKYISRKSLENWENIIIHLLEDFHASKPRETGMEKETLKSKIGQKMNEGTFEAVLNLLEDNGKLEIRAGIVSLKGAGRKLSEKEQREMEGILSAIEQGGFKPPFLKEIAETLGLDKKKARDLASILQEKGLIEAVSADFYLATERIKEAESIVREHIGKFGKLEVGDIKNLLGISRKYSMPLLEYFDRKRVTKRVGDVRVLVER